MASTPCTTRYKEGRYIFVALYITSQGEGRVTDSWWIKGGRSWGRALVQFGMEDDTVNLIGFRERIGDTGLMAHEKMERVFSADMQYDIREGFFNELSQLTATNRTLMLAGKLVRGQFVLDQLSWTHSLTG